MVVAPMHNIDAWHRAQVIRAQVIRAQESSHEMVSGGVRDRSGCDRLPLR
jgi:hypothetical protein